MCTLREISIRDHSFSILTFSRSFIFFIVNYGQKKCSKAQSYEITATRRLVVYTYIHVRTSSFFLSLSFSLFITTPYSTTTTTTTSPQDTRTSISI